MFLMRLGRDDRGGGLPQRIAQTPQGDIPAGAARQRGQLSALASITLCQHGTTQAAFAANAVESHQPQRRDRSDALLPPQWTAGQHQYVMETQPSRCASLRVIKPDWGTMPPLNTINSSAGWSHLAEAVEFAFALHAAQRRKGTTIPYVAHLMSVAALVLEHGGDEEQAIAGLLHDAIEDVGAEQEAVIATRFGPRVAAIVRACTDADTLPKPPWRTRKEAYLAHLEQADADVLLVSACDKLHNARAIVSDLRTHGPAMFGRFTGGQTGTLWYYTALAEVFSRRLPGALAVDLAEAVRDMRRLAYNDDHTRPSA
jgi:HD domain